VDYREDPARVSLILGSLFRVAGVGCLKAYSNQQVVGSNPTRGCNEIRGFFGSWIGVRPDEIYAGIRVELVAVGAMPLGR